MNDRELLELAAKAAGIKYSLRDAGQCWEQFGIPLPKTMSHEPTEYWNPLTDDGDAFRLAVKLRIQNGPRWAGIFAETEMYVVDDSEEVDPYAATRRAIVYAAANIGEKL